MRAIRFLAPIILAWFCAAPAMARPVACPTGTMSAEITTSPDDWTPIPDQGQFTDARVEGAGATLALVCEYGIAGRLTREPPPGERVCTRQGAGFTCRRPTDTDELGPSFGSTQLVEGDTVDLDVKPPSKTLKTGFSSKLSSTSKSIDFTFTNAVVGPNTTGYSLLNSARGGVFARRFPAPNECPEGGSTSAGMSFPLIDPATGKIQTGPMFGCVVSSDGTWFLTRLTDISRTDNKTRATLTWWRF